MEGLFVLFVIFAIVFAVVKAAKKQQEAAGHLPGSRSRRPVGPVRRPPPFPVVAEYGDERDPDDAREAWGAFARDHGLGFTDAGEPRISGEFGGRRVQIVASRLGSVTTRVQTALAAPVPARVVVAPAGTVLTEGAPVDTGDPDFDAAYSVGCRWPELARRVVGESARLWLTALGDAEAIVTGTVASVRTPGVETEPDRLRGLVELVLALAEGAEADA